ncbi:MAG: DUF1329 domain-containing protein [Pseudomonadota bacterium]
MVFPAGVFADQYRSQVKELDSPPPTQTKPADEATLLNSVTDSYARALLLRDLASRSAGNKDYAAAAKYLEQAIELNSLSGPALEEMQKDLTQLFIASGRPKEVIAALEATVGKDPQASPEMQAALASAYVQYKRYKAAIPLLERAISARPNPDETWLAALLSAYQFENREKDAIAVLEKLIRVNPARRDYWLGLAALQFKSGQKERAQATLELAQRQGHLQNVEERLQLIGLTAQIGAPFEAASLMQSWMDGAQLPANADNWKLLAGLWTTARELKLAAKAIEQTLRLKSDPQLFLQLGQLQMDRENYGEAAKSLEEATSRGARSGPALLLLGMAYYQQADFDNALRAFRGAADFGQSRAQAEQWVKFLGSDAARGAIRSALRSTRKTARVESENLSARLQGPVVAVTVGIPLAPDLPGRISDRPTVFSGNLTPIGAESAANSAGTIPAWTGGLTKEQWPANFKPGGRLTDPYADDKPLFAISKANVAQYEDKLTSAHRALIAKYADYTMPVFPTRRSVAYPQAIYDASLANKGKAKLLGSDALTGARLGVPFAEPQNGVEVMWNHRLRYRGDSVDGQGRIAVVRPDGDYSLGAQKLRVLFRYGNLKDPVDIAKDNEIVLGVISLSEGGLSPEFVVLFHETANSMKKARGIWALIIRVGRMLRIPPVGYDQPLFGTDGISYIDMIDMYNGAFDRYVWKLTGKREMYVPYNSFRLNDGRYKNAQLLKPGHFNQDATRYELHRVWMIEATEREGKKHSFGKRVFYVDEDSWNVLLVENYDREGRLWRFQEGHLLPFYESQSANTFPSLTYDLKDSRYVAERLLSEDPPLKFNLPDIDDQEFLPANVKNRYSR